ncbi:MAG TPA: NUDIX domain-containing protein [Candidatus Saccharimonadales bacterium]|nr:NUDIX domain-containing protein [Candidatus Saccharimonadales bacterium]
MSRAKLFFVGIKGLVQNDEGNILLLKADVTNHRGNVTPYWDIPGGRIDEGEDDVVATLEREIKEETGISGVKNLKFFTAVISNHEIPLEEQKKAGLVLMVYTVEVPDNSEIRLSKEHVACEWVDRTEAKKRLAHKYPEEFTSLL